MEYLLDDPAVLVDMLPLTLPAVLVTQVRKLPASLDLRAFCSRLDLPEQVVHRVLLTTGWCAATQKRALSEKPPSCGTDSVWNRELEMIR
jgi:hypothetical protein